METVIPASHTNYMGVQLLLFLLQVDQNLLCKCKTNLHVTLQNSLLYGSFCWGGCCSLTSARNEASHGHLLTSPSAGWEESWKSKKESSWNEIKTV